MDALIKSLRPGKAAAEVKSPDVAPETRPAELDPAEFLAAAVRADLPRPSRSEAEQAVHTLLSYIGENPGREMFSHAVLDGSDARSSSRQPADQWQRQRAVGFDGELARQLRSVVHRDQEHIIGTDRIQTRVGCGGQRSDLDRGRRWRSDLASGGRRRSNLQRRQDEKS